MPQSRDVFAELDVPVSEVNEMFPAIVLMQTKIDLYKRPPLRPLWLPNQMYAGFLRSAIGFARIAFDAGANNILPRRGTASVSGNYMIQVQVLAVESVAAVLTHVFVALENVMPREFNLFLRKMIVNHQQDDTRNSNPKRDGAD